MRGGVLAGGVVMMIIGIILMSFFSVGYSSGGGVAGFFSPQLIGIGLFLLGFIIMIAGLAASSEKKNQGQPIIIQAPTPYLSPRSMYDERAWERLVEGSRNTPSVILAICPNCKKRIPSENKFCPECGYDIQAVPSTNQAPPPPQIEQTPQSSDTPRFCEKCGALREDGIFCKKCGAKVG